VHRIGEVEDIDQANEAKLTGLEIRTTDDLLERAATPTARDELASAIAVDAKEILRWANCADLMRVDGIGMQFADLLEAAGIDTIPELAQRNPANLLAKLEAVNAEGKLTGRAPTSTEVEGWIVQAKALPRILVYSGGAPAEAPAESGSASGTAPTAPSASASAPASAPAAPATATGDAASSVRAAANSVPEQAGAGVSAAADAAASAGARIEDESTAARGIVSESEEAAPVETWLQKLLGKLRGRA
jgi:predicted flap endonuclease-1-like 5' DNA nuclease